MKVFLVLVGLACLLCLSEAGVFSSSVWAVLAVGSNGWENYRHQADLCHAYHVLVNQGVHPERIIVLMYDDIATNPVNPRKGVIVNEPNGPNVYEGVKIDYKGADVTVDVFRNVLLGNKDAVKGKGTGRVLESGPNDHVFINFVDHGAPGIFMFPDKLLYADAFLEILNQMRIKQKYGEMLMYIEACEAGSMFENLLGRYENILVSTASAPDESSWGWYCDNGVCLGDLYSITWMDRVEKLNFSESVFEQFDAVRSVVIQKSHVNLYGDYRLGFIQFGGGNGLPHTNSSTEKPEEVKGGNGVNNRDVPLHLAQNELKNSEDSATYQVKKRKFDNLVQGRRFGENLIASILNMFVRGDYKLKIDLENNRYRLHKNMFDCYKKLISSFETHCFEMTKHYYFLQHLYKFANICVKGLNEADILKAIEITCKSQNQISIFERII